MPNNPENKGHWGNEPVILPRPVKTKGIHPLRVRISETGKESGQFAVMGIGKTIHGMWTPNVVYKAQKFKRNTPVIKINDPTDGIRVLIERPRNPVHLQINTISQNYLKNREGNFVQIPLHTPAANNGRNVEVIRKPLNRAP